LQERLEDFLKRFKKNLESLIFDFKKEVLSFKVGDIKDPEEFFDNYIERILTKTADKEIYKSIKTLKFLKEEHVKNCKAVLDRDNLLKLLPKNAITAEIGVDRGVFSEAILEIANPKKLHLIDLFQFDYQISHIEKKFANNKKIDIVKSDSVSSAELFEDEYFDWIYIDTDHVYETTKAELNAFANKIKPGGYISGHDYFQTGVSNGFSYGVMSAVHEFVVLNNWELVAVTLEPLENQSFLIQKPKK
jgi:cephalosporin hydroxylase